MQHTRDTLELVRPPEAAGRAFCDNRHCVLHAATGDEHVEGTGDWAQVGSLLVSHRHIDGFLVCDACAKRL
jgi:hypothetical protein